MKFINVIARRPTMATINYNGMELEEFTSDKPVFFDKPVRALCWDNNGWQGGMFEYVIAFIPRSDSSIVVTDNTTWLHMALLPDPPKPRRATNRELARWLIEGKAQIRHSDSDMVYVGWNYNEYEDDFPCSNNVLVRKWSDTEWHEPTVDYLFGEE
jgi:hypothetical protein